MMQASYTGFISRVEWSWLSRMMATLLVVTFLPWVIATIVTSANADWQFMGVLHQVDSGAADLSRMMQGNYGDWLMQLKHSPQAHPGILIQPIYALLGHIAAFTGISNILIYHLMRVIATLIMYSALYQLGASIWAKVRARRVFFLLCAVGSGLGWLSALIGGDMTTPDMLAPSAFPYFASLSNLQYPLAIACVAMIAAVFVSVLRPGFIQKPNVNNGGTVMFVLVIGLAALHPPALLPLVGAFAFCVVLGWIRSRSVHEHDSRWVLWAIVPALPIGAYFAALVTSNPVVPLWFAQTIVPRFNVLEMIIGFAWLWFIGSPAIARAFRYFEQDGDRFMLVWLIFTVGLVLLPISLSPAFLLAMVIPLAYFATRALESTWLPRVSRRWQRRLFVIGIFLLSIGPLFVTFVPLIPFLQGQDSRNASILEQDYVKAADWVANQQLSDAVVLAAPTISRWIPAIADVRVIYGHPSETMYADQQRAQALMWLQSTDVSVCSSLQKIQLTPIGNYYVGFILRGREERQLGLGTCLDKWQVAQTFNTVEVLTCDATCRAGE